MFHSHIILLQVVKWKFLNYGESELQFEDDRKNETITLPMDPVKGKVFYDANYVLCHNNVTKKQGSIDSQIYGSSKELLSKKINYGKYTKKYRPKRSGGAMPLMPNLDKEITNLLAFLYAPSRENS